MRYLIKQYFILVVVLSALPYSDALLADNVKMILKNTVSMTSNNVMLKDIATVEITRIGYVNNITVQQIKRIIERNVRDKNINIFFSGAEKVFIRSRGKSYSYKKLKEIAGAALIKELSSNEREVNYSFSVTPKEVKLPFGELRFETRFNTKTVSKKMCVWVDVYRKNSFYRSIPVWVNLVIYEPVYVARHFIERHSVVSSSDFVVARKNIANLSGKHFSENSFSEELLVKQSMNAGDALRSDNVKIVPAIIAGVVLDVAVNEGAVSIKVKGVARKDAELGEVINVKSLQGGGIIKTKVIGKQLVEVI